MNAPYTHWQIADLPWDKLNAANVNPDLLKVIKAAALVEYNADTYADYLCRIFHDDPEFQAMVRAWAMEEAQHGKALGLWAERIDPDWRLEEAMTIFRTGYIPEHFLSAPSNSVRGSRSGEMVARCMVETGTSSYYSAIGDSCDEPVLKEICRLIAADEFRHYKLFYDTLQRYLEKENMGRLRRLKIALGRIAESEDDELAYAFYAANGVAGEIYDRERCNRDYMARAYSFYRPKHLDRAIAMIFKACGFKPHTLSYTLATKIAWWQITSQLRQVEKFGKKAA